MLEFSYSDSGIVELFLSKYENPKSRVRYEATIADFIRMLNFKMIVEIQKDEILNHFDLIKDNAARVCHTKEFLKYLISNELLNKEIVNDGKFVEQVYNFKATQKDPGRTAIQYPINKIIQMDRDIKINYKNVSKGNRWDYERSIKIAFFWELIFDAGFSVGDIKSLKARYLTDKKEYIKSGRKNAIAEMYYSEGLNITKRIVRDYNDRLLLDLGNKKSKDGFSSLLSLEHYNNDELEIYGLLAQDIIAARNKFYIECPNCGKRTKTISTNWIFVKHKDNDGKYLTCNLCKGTDNID